MSHRIGVLCEPFAALGFRLAGLSPRVTTRAGDAQARLDEMLRDEDLGIVLVQETLLPDAGARAAGDRRSGLPLLIPFPGPEIAHPPGEAEAYVAELLRQAVGYRVRLR